MRDVSGIVALLIVLGLTLAASAIGLLVTIPYADPTGRGA